jgi:radical SAM-linked protein
MFKQRILIQFSVRGDIRFISHHDLMRVVGRASRRAKLPVAMSEGFNPRLRISLLLARAVGVASESEFAEIDLDDWISAGDVMRRLNEVLPEGLRVERAFVGDPRTRRRPRAITYRVTCSTAADGETVRALLDEDEVWVERTRRKSGRLRHTRVDIRPFIEDLRVEDDALVMSLRVSDRGTTRPEEVMQALGRDPSRFAGDCTVTRTGMQLSPSV